MSYPHRVLDPVEVTVLTELSRHHDPVSANLIHSRARQGGCNMQSKIRNALRSLVASGYVRAGHCHHSRSRYYGIHDDDRDAVRVQLALRGGVDVYPNSIWSLAALVMTDDAIGPGQLIGPGAVYVTLCGLGKRIDGPDVLRTLELLAADDQVEAVSMGSFRYFRLSAEQRARAEVNLAHFPPMPGYNGDNVPAIPDEENVIGFALAVERPRQVYEYTTRYGAGVLEILDRLIKDATLSRLSSEDDALWGDYDTIYTTEQTRRPRPAYTRVIYGQRIPIFNLSPDEVAILPAVMRRKNRFSPFAISRKVFGDTPYASPPANCSLAEVPLRALAPLHSLAAKGIVACEKHLGRPYKPNYDYFRFCWGLRECAQLSLEHTTGKLHCIRCGGMRESPYAVCEACAKVAEPKTIPHPGERPLAAEDEPVLHAVLALSRRLTHVHPLYVATFAFMPSCEFNCDRAILAAIDRMASPLNMTNASLTSALQALHRLVRDGYVSVSRGEYWLHGEQETWIEINYPTWPHVEALAARKRAAAASGSATARAGRAIEVD